MIRLNALVSALLVIPTGIVLFLFSPRLRYVSAAAAVGWMGYAVVETLLRPRPPDDRLTPAEIQQLFRALVNRVQPGGPNHQHCRRLYYYAPPFSEAAGASVDAVRAAAILHDATKENGRGDPKERFCTHGEQGADYARSTITGLGKSRAFADHVATAVVEHMGPCGFNWRFFDRRFMSRYCAGHDFPEPRSLEARVLYDIDMLDLMTVDGVIKVVELRQGPGFKPEPIKDSARSGKDSAWKSVIDAGQTLYTHAARRCGGELTVHTREFLDGVDWERVTTLQQLKLAAVAYLHQSPLPACLPRVPT